MLGGGRQEKWSRYVIAYSTGICGMATQCLLPKQSVLVFKTKFVNLQPAEPPLRSGRALILKTSMHHCGCTALHLGSACVYGCTKDERKGGSRGEPNLKSDPSIIVVGLRVCQLGRFGAHALRQEQRGGCMGGREMGDGKGDACLPGWLLF